MQMWSHTTTRLWNCMQIICTICKLFTKSNDNAYVYICCMQVMICLYVTYCIMFTQSWTLVHSLCWPFNSQLNSFPSTCHNCMQWYVFIVILSDLFAPTDFYTYNIIIYVCSIQRLLRYIYNKTTRVNRLQDDTVRGGGGTPCSDLGKVCSTI